MRIVTAANKDMVGMLNISKIMNEKIGYNPYIFNLNNELPFGNFVYNQEYSPNKKSRLSFKPQLIRLAMGELKNNITWMDADAFCIKDIDHIFNRDFDVGITLRTLDEKKCGNIIKYGYINAGVLFLKNTKKSFHFLETWEKHVKETESKCDQEALNMYLLPILEQKNVNKIITFGGIKYLILTTHECNYYYFEEVKDKLPEYVKIIHFKSGKRHFLPEILKKLNVANVHINGMGV